MSMLRVFFLNLISIQSIETRLRGLINSRKSFNKGGAMLGLLKQLFCKHQFALWRCGKDVFYVCSKCGKII